VLFATPMEAMPGQDNELRALKAEKRLFDFLQLSGAVVQEVVNLFRAIWWQLGLVWCKKGLSLGAAGWVFAQAAVGVHN
jgi:hypothetical protein